MGVPIAIYLVTKNASKLLKMLILICSNRRTLHFALIGVEVMANDEFLPAFHDLLRGNPGIWGVLERVKHINLPDAIGSSELQSFLLCLGRRGVASGP